MLHLLFLVAFMGESMGAAAPAAAPQQATAASMAAAPQARALFESDWVLMNWALKFYDRDHDLMISNAEAQAAAEQFRKLADVNHDGRVTPQEYRAARAFILAHD